jgi:hypothetical protein
MLTISLLCQVANEYIYISHKQEAALRTASWPRMHFHSVSRLLMVEFEDLLWLNYAERSSQVIVRPGGKK